MRKRCRKGWTTNRELEEKKMRSKITKRRNRKRIIKLNIKI